MHARSLIARNTARASLNRIHDEDTARRYGFAGGLVPGVTVFAWMCGPPMDEFGAEWLERGSIEARFVRPVYDADEVVVEGARRDDGVLGIAVRKGDDSCAVGTAGLGGADERIDVPAAESVPQSPPVASTETLSPGTTLGTVAIAFDKQQAREYLSSIGADHPLVAEVGIAHPGWLLLLANVALSSNVVLGPWIHVSSDVRLLAPVADGERVAARARVVAEYERKGHRFVELDVVLLVGETRPVATVRHTAIYEPRKPEE